MAALGLPPGLDASASLIEGLDRCLRVGFSRLDDEAWGDLDAFVAAFSGTPLGSELQAARQALGGSQFQVRTFTLLAAARAALQGAQADALTATVRAHFGTASAPTATGATRELLKLDSVMPALGSAEQWLMERAIAGFDDLQEDALTPFAATLEVLQAEPQLVGLSVLLGGLLDELSAAAATDQVERPVHRWADLWSASLLRARSPLGRYSAEPVAGEFFPLGIDLGGHASFVQVLIYGVLDAGGERRIARVPFGSYKVPTLSGAEVWELFGARVEPWLTALAERKSIKLNGELGASGEVLVSRTSPPKSRFDPFALAAELGSVAGLPALPAEERHPVQLGELVFLSGAKVNADGDALSVDALSVNGLPLALERVADAEFCDLLKHASELIGLVRFDGHGFRLQPLAAKGSGKLRDGMIRGELEVARRKQLKAKSLPILQERASKLLRA
ncbi:MAG: hypothetical protein AB7K71_28250 [Polyangiaceae bacterium]